MQAGSTQTLVDPTRPRSLTRRTRLGLWLLILLGLATGVTMAGLPATAAAQTRGVSDGSAWAATDHTRVRLIAATEAVGTAASVILGLEFELNPGWHIYWRSPGDAGYPPAIDWTGSVNLGAATVSWPVPERVSLLGFETIAYSNHVVLPIEAKPLEPGRALQLQARVDYLACADICVPYVADLRLDLPAGLAAPGEHAARIAGFVARVPVDEAASGLYIDALDLRPNADGSSNLTIVLRSREPIVDPDVFLEGPSPLAFGPPTRIDQSGGTETVHLSIPVENAAFLPEPLIGATLRVTAVSGDRATAKSVTVGNGVADDATAGAGPLVNTGSPPGRTADQTINPTPAGAPEWGVMLAAALLGGLLLNLMPCVLPVLSLKIMSVVGLAGRDRRDIRAGFLATAAGILLSFMALASVVVALQASGEAVGWGLHFQQPMFLVAITLILVTFAANLWGAFEIPIPGLATRADSLSARPGLIGHVLTGALATVLATPCSAPFVGTAVGFALSRGSGEVFAIFAKLGLGLALPYLLIAAAPGWATRLPRPGRWMITLRRLLGLTLAATAIWLLSVLAAGIGVVPSLGIVAIAMAIVGLLTLHERRPAMPRGFTALGLIGLAAGALVVPLVQPSHQAAAAIEHDAAGMPSLWVEWDAARIPELVKDGRVVYVNVTADWCLTCKVNERLVLARSPVRTALADEGVVAMRADWTTPNPEIAAYLARFGRFGIPFDAVYGPGLPQGEALPELLTGDLVMEALSRAAQR